MQGWGHVVPEQHWTGGHRPSLTSCRLPSTSLQPCGVKHGWPRVRAQGRAGDAVGAANKVRAVSRERRAGAFGLSLPSTWWRSCPQRVTGLIEARGLDALKVEETSHLMSGT